MHSMWICFWLLSGWRQTTGFAHHQTLSRLLRRVFRRPDKCQRLWEKQMLWLLYGLFERRKHVFYCVSEGHSRGQTKNIWRSYGLAHNSSGIRSKSIKQTKRGSKISLSFPIPRMSLIFQKAFRESKERSSELKRHTYLVNQTSCDVYSLSALLLKHWLIWLFVGKSRLGWILLIIYCTASNTETPLSGAAKYSRTQRTGKRKSWFLPKKAN